MLAMNIARTDRICIVLKQCMKLKSNSFLKFFQLNAKDNNKLGHIDMFSE